MHTFVRASGTRTTSVGGGIRHLGYPAANIQMPSSAFAYFVRSLAEALRRSCRSSLVPRNYTMIPSRTLARPCGGQKKAKNLINYHLHGGQMGAAGKCLLIRPVLQGRQGAIGEEFGYHLLCCYLVWVAIRTPPPSGQACWLGESIEKNLITTPR